MLACRHPESWRLALVERARIILAVGRRIAKPASGQIQRCLRDCRTHPTTAPVARMPSFDWCRGKKIAASRSTCLKSAYSNVVRINKSSKTNKSHKAKNVTRGTVIYTRCGSNFFRSDFAAHHRVIASGYMLALRRVPPKPVPRICNCGFPDFP
jgi:hypothetical protein